MKVNRKSLVSGFSVVLLLLISSLSFAQDALSGSVRDQINNIQNLIHQKGAKWVAGETSVSNLPREEWQALVGLSFKPLSAPPIPDEMSAMGVPAALDWRDNGGNFVTKVKNQAKCGSCWAFSLTGGLEAYVLRTQNKPGADVDLSEQVLLSCSGVGSCQGGTLDAEYLQTTGLPLEKAYPYTATDGTCSSAAAGWENQAYKIDSWGSVSQKVASIKSALAKYGPLPTAMMVYEDFMHYKSGIYSYTTGKKLGGHAVLLVGYNDAEQYFIVKNSWTPGWGEAGFFRIAYSEMSNSINFGLSTIAFKSAGGKDASAAQRQAETNTFDPDKTWERLAPMFEPALHWQ